MSLFNLPALSNEKLTELTKLTGGVALLLAVAVGISYMPSNSSLSAAVVCNAGTCEQQPSNGYTLTLDVGSATVDSGESATINWDVRDGSNNPPPPLSFAFSSFGNGVTENQALQTIGSNGTHTTYPRGDLLPFKVGSDTYLSVLRGGTNSWALYKFSTALNCLHNGSGSSCPTSGGEMQTVNLGTPLSQKVFTYNNNTYIAVTNTSNTYIYKWKTSGCTNTVGFGNDSSCGSAYQTISVPGQSVETFVISSGTYAGTYLAIGGRSSNDVKIYKWTSSGSGCPSGGAFGNGSNACGSVYKTLTIGSVVAQDLTAFVENGSSYLAVGTLTGGCAVSGTCGLKVYKWLESGTGTPCFGDGNSNTCNTPHTPSGSTVSYGTRTLSNVNSVVVSPTKSSGERRILAATTDTSGNRVYPFLWYDSALVAGYFSSFGDNNLRAHTVTDGYDTYLVTGSHASTPTGAKIYKWNASSNCFGDSTGACDTPLFSFTFPSSRSVYGITAFPVDGTWYAAVLSSNNSSLFLYKATPPPPCFGGTDEECGNHIKDNSGSPALGQTINHTFDWEPFKIGSNWYVARAAQSGYWYDRVSEIPEYVDSSQHSVVYKWHPAEEAFGHKTGTVTNTTCYDGTSTCIDYKGPFNNKRMNGTVYQDIFSHTAYDWMAFTMGGGTYLMLSSDPAAGSGTVGSQLYKWGTQASKGTAGGLTGEYFGNEWLYGSSIARTDSGSLDFDYGSGKPTGVDSVITSNNDFSIRWTGTIVAPVAGTYTFTLDADDGARLWLDDILVLDKWYNNGSNSYTVNNVQANQNISVRIEYHEDTGNARARLYWAYPGQTTQIIPASNLYPNQVATEGCLGNGKTSGTTCGSPFQTMAVSATDSTFFTTGTGSYLLMAGSTGRLYKWESSLNSGVGCFSGNGTDCDTFASTLQTVNASNPWALATTTVGSDLYVAMGLAGSSNGVRIYKWRTSGTSCLATGSFGNTSNCDTSTTYQTLAPGTVKEVQFFNPSLDGTLDTEKYLAVASNADNKIYIYKWITGGSAPCNLATGGGFGSGTTCGAYLQNNITFTSNPNTLKIVTIGGNTYLAVKQSNDNETARIFKWQGSCFGDGTNCGTAYFTVTLGSATEDTNAFLFFTPDTTNYYFAFGGEGSNPDLDTGNRLDSAYLYKWLDSSVQEPQSACEVTWSSASGSGSLGSADSAGPIATDPLTEDTTFTLTCDGFDDSVSKIVTVNEPVTTPTITISATDSAAAEDASPANPGTFRIQSSAPVSADLPVTVSIGGIAQNGVDYATISTTATILSGQSTVDITVTPLTDLIYEGAETVVLTVEDPGDSSYLVGASPDNTATVTIADDETGSTLPATSGPTFTACLGAAGASCNLGITPDRVRRGSQVTVTWNVPGLIVGENGNDGTLCQILRTPDDVTFPLSSSAGATSWVNTSPGQASTINQQTIFTLRCTSDDGSTKSVSKTVQLLPNFQEI